MLKFFVQTLHLLLLLQTGNGTLTSNITGGGACPGDVITFNCTQDPLDSLLRWGIQRANVTVSAAQFTFPPAQPPVVERTLSGNVSGTAAIISYSPSTTVVSTLTITVTRQLDGNVVECSGTTPGSIRNTTINIASLPSPPQNVMVTIVQNGTTTVTVNIDWDPPVNNGGVAVDSYTVETSPETDTVRVTSGATATLDLSYNERYVVSVTAVNCVGSSTPALTDPVEFAGCPLLSNPNVIFEPYTSSAVGSMISYQCRPGFIPDGTIVMSVCGGDGQWNPDPEQYSCREVNCRAPNLPVNSSMLSGPSSGTGKGSEVTFQCNDGLFPSIEITIVCTSEERWSPDPEGIVCGEQPVSCSCPNVPRNGFLDEVTSTTIMFGCEEGYSPNGTRTAECVAPDSWSPDPALLECTSTTPPTNVVDCGSPQPPVNGMVTDITSTLEGSEVTFQCNITSIAVCNRDRRWSPDPGQRVCGFESGASYHNQVVIAAVCSVVFYIGGVVSGLLIYLAITRCKETCKQVAITSSGRSEAPNTAAPVYEDIPGVVSVKAGIELQENVAYGPVKK